MAPQLWFSREAGEDLGQLEADGAPAEHDHRPWQLLDRERLAIRPEGDVGEAGNGRPEG